MKKDSFKVEYQYVPSKQSEARLQKGFEIIFEKIIKPREQNVSTLGKQNSVLLGNL